MLYKICRLCPNTARWTRPTEKIGENKKAYTSKFGFGFEEWLNREDWLLSGYPDLEGEWRYVHVQGMLTKHNAHEGQTTSILFYVKESGRKPQAVAYLENAYVIDELEAAWAAKQFAKKRWLHLMHEEVKVIGGSIDGLPPIPKNDNKLTWDNPLYYANIRFTPGSLRFFDEPKVIAVPSYYYSTALDWDGVLPTQNYSITPVKVPNTSGTKKGHRFVKDLGRFSEAIRERRAAAGKPYVPRQAPIQNALAVQLDDFYKQKGYIITCEDERVDIKIEAPDSSATFIEIKPASSAREAIRLAIGQLIEYSHYPVSKKAKKLVIVSDAEPKHNDFAYIKHLQKIYSIPLGYVYWPLGAKSIAEENLRKFV